MGEKMETLKELKITLTFTVPSEQILGKPQSDCYAFLPPQYTVAGPDQNEQ